MSSWCVFSGPASSNALASPHPSMCLLSAGFSPALHHRWSGIPSVVLGVYWKVCTNTSCQTSIANGASNPEKASRSSGPVEFPAAARKLILACCLKALQENFAPTSRLSSALGRHLVFPGNPLETLGQLCSAKPFLSNARIYHLSNPTVS